MSHVNSVGICVRMFVCSDVTTSLPCQNRRSSSLMIQTIEYVCPNKEYIYIYPNKEYIHVPTPKYVKSTICPKYECLDICSVN